MGPWTVTDQLRKLAYWNDGLNHLVIEIHDSEQLRYDIGTLYCLHLEVLLIQFFLKARP